jgi:hypothetical protein
MAHEEVYVTSHAVQGYVVAFDAGEPIEPFTFRLDKRRRLHVRRRVLAPAGKAAINAAGRARRVAAKARRTPPPGEHRQAGVDTPVAMTGSSATSIRTTAPFRSPTPPTPGSG